MPLLFLCLLMLAIWLGHLASFYLVQRLPFSLMFMFGPCLPVFIPALFCVVALFIGNQLEQARSAKSYLKHLARIGSPLERDGTYEITDEALVLTTERMVLAPRWNAIDTIERGEVGWVVSADQLHFLIPYDAFASADAQRPLLSAITSRLTPEARARSREAVDFAAVAPETTVSRRPQTSPQAASDDPKEKQQDVLPDAPVAKGWLTQEQASWAAGVILARVANIGFHRWAFPLVASVSGVLLGMLVAGSMLLLPFELLLENSAVFYALWLLGPIVGGACGLAYAHKRSALLLDKAWRQGLAERGVPEQVEARWSLTGTGVRYETAHFSGHAPFASIHQVLHESDYWIIGVDALTLCIPATAFASQEDAQAFMSQLLSRIEPAARERSVSIPDEASS